MVFDVCLRSCYYPDMVLGVMVKSRTIMLVFLRALVCFGLAACGAPATTLSLGSQPTALAHTPTPQPATDEEAIHQLILLEGQGVVSQDIGGLMNLWAPEAVITDAKHTPDNPNDDARWRGRDAIRERYVVLVFPGNPNVDSPADVRIVIDGDKATATSTTQIGAETSPGGDRWDFVKRDGRWWVLGLTYNLEPK
jgi:SnoaL-like domain